MRPIFTSNHAPSLQYGKENRENSDQGWPMAVDGLASKLPLPPLLVTPLVHRNSPNLGRALSFGPSPPLATVLIALASALPQKKRFSAHFQKYRCLFPCLLHQPLHCHFVFAAPPPLFVYPSPHRPRHQPGTYKTLPPCQGGFLCNRVCVL